MSAIKAIAFDVFGTLLDMSKVSQEEIWDYVEHVKKESFSPYFFPREWDNLRAHPDVAEGLTRLSSKYRLFTLSNGPADLVHRCLSECLSGKEKSFRSVISVTDLAAYRAYKPNLEAYTLIFSKYGWRFAETMLVTANPTFGDVEKSRHLGMTPQIIRQEGYPADVIELAKELGC